MKRFSQMICLVLDGVGVGAAPDAADYGDTGSNSLANTADHVGSLRLPALEQLGLGNIIPIAGVAPASAPRGCYGKMQPAAVGKDSTTGHWELMGCVLGEPFPTYPDGFPAEVIDRFQLAIGRRTLGNRTASGTVIIQELGEEHLRTGFPIVYTSQDSVFQIAAHEEVFDRDGLYHICETAREILRPPHGVGRVIARPFSGTPGGFYRTTARKDFSLPPTSPTLLDTLSEEGRTVLAIGKIADLFCGRGIERSVTTSNNREGMDQTLATARGVEPEFVFANLVDFDTMWGHRNDARAYALGLEEFDSYLNDLLDCVDPRTLLIITSDHGNDPTTPSTDHSREFVPLIVYHKRMECGVDLGTRKTLADIAATAAENFHLKTSLPGSSFLADLPGDKK